MPLRNGDSLSFLAWFEHFLYLFAGEVSFNEQTGNERGQFVSSRFFGDACLSQLLARQEGRLAGNLGKSIASRLRQSPKQNSRLFRNPYLYWFFLDSADGAAKLISRFVRRITYK
jgi:hypothetical protein